MKITTKVPVDRWDVEDDATGKVYVVRMTLDREYVSCTCTMVEVEHLSCDHIKAITVYLNTWGSGEMPMQSDVVQ